MQMENKRKHFKKMYTYHIKEMLFVSNCKRNLIKFSVYIVILVIAIIISSLPHILSNKTYSLRHYNTRFLADLKYILFWSPPKSKKKIYRNMETIAQYQTGQSMFIKQKCPFINCYLTYNRSLLHEDWNFDAIVFDEKYMRNLNPNHLNLTRSDHQKYVFRSLESSVENPVCNHFYDNFFNWTWTYKLDSDLPHPFFNIFNETNALVGPNIKMDWLKKMKRTDRVKSKIREKKKAVAWLVNKCKLKSKHKDFVEDLQNELKGYNHSLDTFGPCGDKKCPTGKGIKCNQVIEKQYYFQLVLEDSLAEDYVTEMLMKVMTHVTIPIVVGGADYNRFLPPGAFINAQTFTLKKLGAIIDYLIKNPKLYEYFFDWMNHYYYVPRARNYLCDLCTKLNNRSSVDVKGSYKHFRHWWNADYKDVCEQINLFRMFNKDFL